MHQVKASASVPSPKLSSWWREGPFVAVNCATLVPTLAEAELFGYRKGASTGAERASAGHFRAAQAGTLLLDEIADLPEAVQAKLLRVLEQREILPLGESTPVPIDFASWPPPRFRLHSWWLSGVFEPTCAPASMDLRSDFHLFASANKRSRFCSRTCCDSIQAAGRPRSNRGSSSSFPSTTGRSTFVSLTFLCAACWSCTGTSRFFAAPFCPSISSRVRRQRGHR